MGATVTNRTGSARGKARRDWRPAFLKALAEHGTVCRACKVAGISRSTAYREQQRDEAFALLWYDVEHEVTDAIEQKAVELALDGDTRMIEFLLKARAPEKYRERYEVKHAGSIKQTHEVDLARLSTPEKRALLDLIEKAADAPSDV